MRTMTKNTVSDNKQPNVNEFRLCGKYRIPLWRNSQINSQMPGNCTEELFRGQKGQGQLKITRPNTAHV